VKESFLQYYSLKYWMGSINSLSFSAQSFLSINGIFLFLYSRDSNLGQRDVKRERYLCDPPL